MLRSSADPRDFTLPLLFFGVLAPKLDATEGGEEKEDCAELLWLCWWECNWLMAEWDSSGTPGLCEHGGGAEGTGGRRTTKDGDAGHEAARGAF